MKNENIKINFKKVLKEELNKIGIDLDDSMLIMFEQYKELLVEWNEKMNLTSITEDYDVIMKHFVDCLEIVKYIPENANIIDVGTGAGFPGIVIAIYFNNNIKITLLDSLNKRLEFLKEVVKILELKNINIVHERAEEGAHKVQYRGKYDVVVSRAVANLSVLLEITIAYVKEKGKCLFLKGDNVDLEIQNCKNTLKTLDSTINKIYNYKYILNNESYNRNIVEIVKNKKTSEIYPRNYGQIKKKILN